METEIAYPSQFVQPSRKIETLNPADHAVGAPFAPLPRSFYLVDPRLDVAQPVATEQEIADTVSSRAKFRVGEYGDPYVADVLRAFRMLRGKKFYLEIGIFDRGNLAYISSLLDPDAVLIGIDVQDDPERDALLRASLKPGQTFHAVIASSRTPDAVNAVREILGSNKLDAVFIDGDHTAYGALADYALYEEFVANDGIFLFHDSVWEGDEMHKGVCDALDEISRVDTIYLIDGANPVRRFCRPLWRDSLWGVVGVVFASDQKWRIGLPR
ncbi:class I SAM-dependent methyltransferase [Novosphingobium sp. ERN07]|uniref:class I SAM-dependent methyltransferase n=1 Tax=Novosphingobium sp. ERN07 TaxID=2726187 RepID=UPI001457656D|nr:class I SAM-dependent methyltransferase [Novosphingobium sp. ERN07]NLR72478.1 class I SAM-dependent methyltransferase [Novosphingobium sp. ERN07]